MTCVKGVDCHADLGHDSVWSQYSTNTKYFKEFNGRRFCDSGYYCPKYLKTGSPNGQLECLIQSSAHWPVGRVWWFEWKWPHRPRGNGTIGSCDLVGLGVILLKEVCHWEWALGLQKLKPDPVSLPLPAFFRLGCRTLSLPLKHHACLQAAMFPAMMTMN